jgi:hypothetical protein
MFRRASLLAVCFIPMIFLAFLSSGLGDCRPSLTRAACSAGKQQALNENLLIVATAYVSVLIMRSAYRWLRDRGRAPKD